MSGLIKPGQGILYMKVGVHAQEPLEEIIARKKKEIDDAGFTFWGYGGMTCHPKTMVQPFAKEASAKGETIFLCMQEIVSNHNEEPVRASQYSVDGIKWLDVPKPIDALGSRYALAIKDLRAEECEIPLERVEVAIGKSRGRVGSGYIKGQVDKACFRIRDDVDAPKADHERIIGVSLVAELLPPYAVFLKN